MMALEYRYHLGFERLCEEVSDSVSWRRFCRLPLDEVVPHPSTLEKITTRCGHGAVDALNEALVAKAAEDHLVKLDKLRADTTVVPANVVYPSDAGLLKKGVSRLAVLTSRLKAMGLAGPHQVPGPAPLDEVEGTLDRHLVAPPDRRGKRRGAGNNCWDGQDRRGCPGGGLPGGGQLGTGPRPAGQTGGPPGQSYAR